MNQYSSQQPQFDIKKITPLITGFAILLFFVIFGSKMYVKIESGHAGVLYKQFGGGVDKEEYPLGQGFHLIAPWNSVIDYEVRQKERSEKMTVLSSNLLKIDLDATIFYNPIESKLGYLEVERGRNYENDVVLPVLRSITREVIAQYLPEEINTTKREKIQSEIMEQTAQKLEQNYVQLKDILIRNIRLPEKLQASIERKLQQEQESLEYVYRLEKEQKEAERKKIEAEGVKQFQTIVTQSITDKLLRWKGIEATLELAKSENAKVVVVGSGKDGLPIILGNQ